MSTSYKRLSFTNEEEENLIEFIKRHPALWDASHVEYGNGELRKIYWMTIATELNKTVLECRRKWRFIRDYYIHKRRRIADSTPQRDGKYFNLHFLDKVSVRRFANPSRHTTLNSYSQEGETDKCITHNIERVQKVEHDFEDSEVEYNFTSDVTFEKVTMERVDQLHNYYLDDEDGHRINQDQDVNDEPPMDAMSNEDFSFDENSEVHEFVVDNKPEEQHLVQSESAEIVQSKPMEASMHEKAIDLFFESMAAAVKTFPPQYIAEAKFKVFNAINELEMKVHNGVNKK